MLLVGYAVFAASPAQAQVPSGDVCVEGIVIDWEENPLAGWVITLTSDITDFTPITTISASEPENDDFDYYDKHDKKSKKYPFEYREDDSDLEKGEFEFTEDDIAAASGITDTSVGAQQGIYTATIETRPGWEGVTPTTISFPIEVDQDGCVKIRFKMRRIVVVTVFKIDADHLPLGDWRITAVPGPGNLFASPQQETTAVTDTAATTDTAAITAGAAVFTLTPGLWIFTEQAPKTDMGDPRDSYVPVVPPTGRQELLIPDPEDLDPDEAFTLVFKNELVTGCFIVRKFSSVPAPPPANGEGPVVASPVAGGFNVAGWGFQLLRKDGSVARQGVTDGRGELRFDNLPLGPYTIVEEDRAGWNEITPRSLDYIVAGNACTDPDDVIEFTNEQDDSGFCIEGRKVDANGGYGLAGWEIEIEALDEGGADPVDDIGADAPEEITSTVTDGLGEFRFDFLRDDYRVPGGTYEVCEVEQDGWQPHNPTCQTVRLPEWPGACVQLEDFVNQQVGHTESQDHGKNQDHGKDQGKGGYDDNGGNRDGEYGNNGGNRDGGPSYGGNDVRCSEYHVVKAGEGLFDIGNQYHKSAQQMLDANPAVRDGDQLWVYEGQRICIP
jgi:hypothetical protein